MTHFVFRFELYENLSFLSSLEVLPRTTDPYLWISDSEWRIFLTYLGTSSKWREFLPFRKPPNRHPPFPPPFVLGFIPIFVLDEFHPKSETILHHLVIKARLFRFRIRLGLSFSSSSLLGFCRVVLVRWFGFLVVHFVLSSSFPFKLWWFFFRSSSCGFWLDVFKWSWPKKVLSAVYFGVDQSILLNIVVPCYCECASQESTNSETLPQDLKALAEIVRSLRKPPILL